MYLQNNRPLVQALPPISPFGEREKRRRRKKTRDLCKGVTAIANSGLFYPFLLPPSPKGKARKKLHVRIELETGYIYIWVSAIAISRLSQLKLVFTVNIIF